MVSDRGAKHLWISWAVMLVLSQIGWSPALAEDQEDQEEREEQEEQEEQEGGLLDQISEWFESSSTGTRPPKSIGGREESQRPSSAVGEADRFPSPGGAYRIVQDLIAEAALLREDVGVYGVPPESELQPERLPVHVYVKAQEVLSKVIGIQVRFGVPAAQSGRVPFKEVDWGDVEQHVLYVLDELRKIKARWNMEGEIEPATLEVDMSPAQVYRRLSYASFLLDGLLGRPLTPDDVFLICASVLGDVEIVASELGVPLDLEVPDAGGDKNWKDVARQVKLATLRMISLQTRLGMRASIMPKLTMVRVTPSEVFDYSNTLLAETARIKFRLGIDMLPEEPPDSDGKTADDVFELVLGITKALDTITAAIGG